MMRKAWSSIEEMPCCFSRSSVKFQGHTWQKIADFQPNWMFPDSNFSLNSPPMAMKAYSLKQHRKGALLFFKVIHRISRSHGTKKSPILTRIERFWTVTPVWIHRWRWNDAQSMIYYVEEVPYNFSRSSIKFYGHTDWKINDLNPIWARLLGRSQYQIS